MGDIPIGHAFLAIAALILFVILLHNAFGSTDSDICGRGWYLLMLTPLFAMLWYSFILRVYTDYRRGMSSLHFPSFGDLYSSIKDLRGRGAKISPATIIADIMGDTGYYMPNPWMVLVMFTLFLMFIQFTISAILMYKFLPGHSFGSIMYAAFMPSAFMMFIAGIISSVLYFVATFILPKIKFPPVIPIIGMAIEVVMTLKPSQIMTLFFPHTMIFALMGYGIACTQVSAQKS